MKQTNITFLFKHFHFFTLLENQEYIQSLEAYQIYFGVFFHNALVLLRIITIPAVTLSIIV